MSMCLCDRVVCVVCGHGVLCMIKGRGVGERVYVAESNTMS